jgi:sortase A
VSATAAAPPLERPGAPPDAGDRPEAAAVRSGEGTLPAGAAPGGPPPLPVPAPLPDPDEQVPLIEVGRIRIDRLGIDEIVREGVQQMVIDAGVAHWPGTPLAGGWGNAVLAGHRSSHTAPFLRLGELTPGDVIDWSGPGGAYRYRVTGVEVVGADALWIVDQRPGHHLTIFTCHPIGSSAQRLVVRAELDGTAGP